MERSQVMDYLDLKFKLIKDNIFKIKDMVKGYTKTARQRLREASKITSHMAKIFRSQNITICTLAHARMA